jgi:hypothetical protein
MTEFVLALLVALRVFFRTRRDTALEILALRQQVAVLKCKRPRPLLNSVDRLFWTTLRRIWSRWAEVLVIVKPETVVGWHRAGIAERWVGSCRREILDHIIALNEQHLRRLIRDYVNYYHEDRIHDSLEKDTPNTRPVEQKPAANPIVISIPRLGGLHHRYAWRQAA